MSGRSGARVQAWLAGINVLFLALLAAGAVGGWSREEDAPKELSLERLNIVGANGKPVLVLADRERIPGPTFGGKEYPRAMAEGRELLSGMIFFNEAGDEVGGLLFNGFEKGEGATDYGALGHLSFDQWKQNQVLALQYNDHGTSRRAGLAVWDRPVGLPLEREFERRAAIEGATGERLAELRVEEEAARAAGSQGAQRLFVGSRDEMPQLELRDSQGRVRARIYVDSGDAPHLDFLDGQGAVVATYPPRLESAARDE